MKSLAGHLLVATPDLLDPNFARSVVLIVRHDDEGALGLIVNRPTRSQVREAWTQVSDSVCLREDFLYHGGPCQGPLMILHDRDDASQLEVASDVRFTFEVAQAEALVTSVEDRARFYVGHSGWGPGQLEGEIREGAWQITRATASDVFDDAGGVWQRVRDRIGREQVRREVDDRFIPEDPSMN